MRALGNRGHELHLVTRGNSNPRLAELINQSGAHVHIRPWIAKAPVVELLPRFNKWVRDLAPDIYVISSSAAIGWLILPWLPESIPAYTIGHNDEKTFYEPVKHYYAFLSGAIGVSQQICEKYIRDCNMLPERVSWIPYGVKSAKEINVPEIHSQLRLVYVGRIDAHQKRILDLAAVLSSLSRKKIPYVCDIVGDGPDMVAFREKLKGEVPEGQIVFHGWLDKESVLSVLSKADIFLLTSAFEGFSIALTEAMAYGCCPVVTNIKAGNQQLIQSGENGFLIEVGDIEGFVNTISLLAENRNLLERLRLRAWDTAKEYSIARMAEKYELLFSRDLAKGKCKPAKPDEGFPVMPSCQSKYPIWLRRVKAWFETRPSV